MILSGIKTEEEEQKAENESQPKHSQWPFSQVQLLKKKKKNPQLPPVEMCVLRMLVNFTTIPCDAEQWRKHGPYLDSSGTGDRQPSRGSEHTPFVLSPGSPNLSL